MSDRITQIQAGIEVLKAAGCTLLVEVLEQELAALIRKEMEKAS
jgi:hypothetical protein